MNFDFTEEQLALQDTVRRFVARDYTFEKRRAIRDAAPGLHCVGRGAGAELLRYLLGAAPTPLA